MDPVVHHDFSPYSAFDNNPVFWSDPSGADSQTYITLSDLWNKAGSGLLPIPLKTVCLQEKAISKA